MAWGYTRLRPISGQFVIPCSPSVAPQKGQQVLSPNRIDFSKRTIDALKPQPNRYLTGDVRVQGLFIVTHPSGAKVFLWYRRVVEKPVKKTIGNYGDLTVEQARTRAEEFNARLGKWKNDGCVTVSPFDKGPTKITLKEVFELYVVEHLSKKPNPQKSEAAARELYERGLATLGDRPVAAIRMSEITKIHTEISETGKIAANRVVELLRRVWRWGLAKGKHSAPDIFRGFEYNPKPKPRDVTLEPNQQWQFFKALDAEKNRTLRDYIEIALATAARKSDILSMRWQDVDLANRVWTVPEPKGGAINSYRIPLQDETVRLLKKRRRDVSEPSDVWIFPSWSKSGHITGLKKCWVEFKQRASVPNIRLHDLRRTTASMQIAKGASLPIVSHSLGHKNIASVKPYNQPELEAIRASIGNAYRAMRSATKPRRTGAAK